VAAAVLERRRLARRIEKENDVLSEDAKGFRPLVELGDRQGAYQKLRRIGWRVLSMGGFPEAMREAAGASIATQEPRRRSS
jgi:hypothetical protein